MKSLNSIFVIVLLIASSFLVSCQGNSEEDTPPDVTPSFEKNTAKSTNATGQLNYFTIHDTGSYFQFTVSEKAPSLQNPDWGIKIDLMLKELPTQTTTLDHRVEPNFNVQTGEYYLNTVNLVSEIWHSPFINSRPTSKLEVTVENNIATFTIIDAELSDNFVAPITMTDKISLSFSLNMTDLNANPNLFKDLAN